MKFTGKRIAMALAVPLVVGLVVATANSGVVYQADGKGGSPTCAYHKTGAAKCDAQKAKAGCCAGKMSRAKCGNMKGASDRCAGKMSGAKCGNMKATAPGSSCDAGAASCPLKMVRTDEALKVYMLGDVNRTGDWLRKLASGLSDDQGLETEVFEAKDGSWIEIRPGSNAGAYSRLVKASSDPKECCKILCSSAGCPPKA